MNLWFAYSCRLQVFVRSFKVSWNSNNALCNVICFFICLQQLTTFLVDFGLSNICRGDDLLKTQCGSPEYAAPELFKRGCRYGTEVDLWSLWVNNILFCRRSKLLPISGLSLRAGGRELSPATKRVAPGYFYWKIEGKWNKKKSLAVWSPTYLLYLPATWNLSDNPAIC